MIDFKDAEAALDYLKKTDTEAARLKSLYMALDDVKKTVLAVEYEKQEGSAADKTQKALASESYKNHLNKISEAFCAAETLRNKRKSAELQIELWRSINSNQRRGNV